MKQRDPIKNVSKLEAKKRSFLKAFFFKDGFMEATEIKLWV